jgi:hypothetical protein
MSETSHEFGTSEPIPAELLKTSIQDLFDAFPANIERGITVREFEEVLRLSAPDVFDGTPAAHQFSLERPIPGLEKEALEKWPVFNGSRIKILENLHPGLVETDFWIKDKRVLKRQQIVNPGDRYVMPSETYEGWIGRRSSEMFADILSLEALDAATRAQSIRARNEGEEVDPETLDSLLKWIKTGRPVSQYD